MHGVAANAVSVARGDGGTTTRVLPSETTEAWSRVFAQHGRQNVWHITHVRNLAGILVSGLLDHHESRRRGLLQVDISDPAVQQRRRRLQTCHGKSVCHYVPLYIEQRNPMLYRLRAMQHMLCLLEISLDCLRKPGCVLADGNAASPATRFYDAAADGVRLPWSVLDAATWFDQVDGRRKRCAEVLVPRLIETADIRAIHCMRRSVASMIRNSVADVRVSPGLYFGN